MRSLHSQSATVNLATGATVLSHTVTTATALADLIIEVGNGTNNLAAAAETTLTVAITIDSVPVRGVDPTETVAIGRGRLRIPVDMFPVAAGETVAVTLTSDKAADTAVTVTATLRDASPLQPVTKGNQALVDAEGKVTGTSTYTELVATAVDALRSGGGEHAVTVTVSDSSGVIQGARVSIVGTTLKVTTGSAGTAVFHLDAGSYSVRVSSPSGYADPADTSVTVDGTEAVPITITTTGTVTPPADPLLATLAVLCVDEAGAIESGVTIDAKLVEIPSGGTGLAYLGTKQTATSGVDGVATLTVVRLATYMVKRGTSSEWAKVVIADEGTTTIKSFIGAP